MSSVSQSLSSLMQTANQGVYSLSYNAETGETKYDNANFDAPIWAETNQMGKDQFLYLLVTQLKYQDPLEPMENTQFVSQLAQFRALETGENTVSALGELQSAFSDNLAAQMYASQSISNSSAMSLIGKDVRMLQTTVSWEGKAGTQMPVRVHLGNKASAVVNILNADGEIVKSFNAAGKDAENSVLLNWDGTDKRGEHVKAGKYEIQIEGSDSDPSLYAYVQAIVEGVRFTTDGVMVKIDGREIHIAEVLDVSIGEEGFMSQSSALSLMGKHVKARHEILSHSAASATEHGITVNAKADEAVMVEIKNSAGKVVATLRGAADANGTARLHWNGRLDDGGEIAASGEYRINVVGSDKNPGLYAYVEGIVDGMTSLTGDFRLKIGGSEISVHDIMDITTPKIAA